MSVRGERLVRRTGERMREKIEKASVRFLYVAVSVCIEYVIDLEIFLYFFFTVTLCGCLWD